MPVLAGVRDHELMDMSTSVQFLQRLPVAVIG